MNCVNHDVNVALLQPYLLQIDARSDRNGEVKDGLEWCGMLSSGNIKRPQNDVYVNVPCYYILSIVTHLCMLCKIDYYVCLQWHRGKELYLPVDHN